MITRITKEDNPVMFLFTLDQPGVLNICKDVRRNEWRIETKATAVREGDKVLIDLGDYGNRFEGRVVGVRFMENIFRVVVKEL